jgi:hypothetical protein
MKFIKVLICSALLASILNFPNTNALADYQSTGQLTMVPFQMGSSWVGGASSASTHSSNTFTAYLPPCIFNSKDICIKKVSFSKEGIEESNLSPQSLKTNIPEQMSTAYVTEEWEQDPARGLPIGSRPGYWNINGREVLISALVSGTFNGNWKSKDTRFEVLDLRIGVASNEMASLSEFRIKITLDLKQYINKINLFLMGRLDHPDISTENNYLTISGLPTWVYQVKPAIFKLDSLPSEVKDYFLNLCGSSRCYDIADPATWNSSTKSVNFSFRGIKDFQIFEKYLPESASDKQYVWQIEGAGFNFMNYAKKDCFTKGSINGLLTTNAMLYESTPPIWNSIDGSIDYTLASVHLDDSNIPIKGNYNLILSTTVAKCIWGIDEIPSQAIIGVEYSGSSPDISTLTLSKNDNWVSFNVDNFHFSTPKISIKLAKKPSPTKTIQCTKGRTKKKITGSNPKCPTGYKLKVS